VASLPELPYVLIALVRFSLFKLDFNALCSVLVSSVSCLLILVCSVFLDCCVSDICMYQLRHFLYYLYCCVSKHSRSASSRVILRVRHLSRPNSILISVVKTLHSFDQLLLLLYYYYYYYTGRSLVQRNSTARAGICVCHRV
jgi:hypothetical protein